MAVLRKPSPATKTCSNPACARTQDARLFQKGKARCNDCLAAATRDRARTRGVTAAVERFRVVDGIPQALCMEADCRRWMTYDAFWRDGRSGKPLPRCKSCRTKHVHAWKAAHPERTREIQRVYHRARAADPAKAQRRRDKANESYDIRKEWGSVAAWREWCRQDAIEMFWSDYWANHMRQIDARSDEESL